jgi:hypothetical protein
LTYRAEHDFSAESLLAADQDLLAVQVLAIPFRPLIEARSELELGGPVLIVFPAAGVFTGLKAQEGAAKQQVVVRSMASPAAIAAAAPLVSPSSMQRLNRW